MAVPSPSASRPPRARHRRWRAGLCRCSFSRHPSTWPSTSARSSSCSEPPAPRATRPSPALSSAPSRCWRCPARSVRSASRRCASRRCALLGSPKLAAQTRRHCHRGTSQRWSQQIPTLQQRCCFSGPLVALLVGTQWCVLAARRRSQRWWRRRAVSVRPFVGWLVRVRARS